MLATTSTGRLRIKFVRCGAIKTTGPHRRTGQRPLSSVIAYDEALLDQPWCSKSELLPSLGNVTRTMVRVETDAELDARAAELTATVRTLRTM